MTDQIIITAINVIIVESAVFTILLNENSQRILSFSLMVLSAYGLLTYTNAEFFGLLLVLAFLPVILILFMLGNMVKTKEKKQTSKKVCILAATTSGIITSVLSFYGKFVPVTQKTDIKIFLTGLYEKHAWTVLTAAILAFVTVLTTVAIFYDEKKREQK